MSEADDHDLFCSHYLTARVQIQKLITCRQPPKLATVPPSSECGATFCPVCFKRCVRCRAEVTADRKGTK